MLPTDNSLGKAGQAITDLKRIKEYLRWWRGPESAELRLAINRAYQGAAERERAAILFAKYKQRLPISPVPAQNQALLELILGASPDIITRQVVLGKAGLPAMLFHTNNMADKRLFMRLLENLMIGLRDERFPTEPDALIQFLVQRTMTTSRVVTVGTVGELVGAVLEGDTALVVQGLDRGLRLATLGWERRKPEEPTSEPVVRGPKEGFVETAATNLVLLRWRLNDERLRVEQMTVGTRTGTLVYLVYLLQLARPELVDEVRRRVQSAQVDSIQDSGMLEELIEDTSLTPFPLMKATERPDVVAAELLEGKFALIVDGSPHVLTAPATFAGGMQAGEDYYERWMMASFVRVLRYIFLMIALLGPSTYIAITTFHQEMLPTDLLLSLAMAREGVPFPSVVEALVMELTFEALREAGVRLPKTVGQAVSIVGALVIGEAAVRARLVSPVMVIVVAVTGIASFVIPNFSTGLAIRLLRFPMMILAGMFGMYGIVLGLLALSIHLSSLRSFGVPYMAPTMPPHFSDFKDLMIRVPWWAMRRRPGFMPVGDRRRQPPGQSPKPPLSP